MKDSENGKDGATHQTLSSGSSNQIDVSLEGKHHRFLEIFSDSDDIKFQNYAFGRGYHEKSILIYCESLVQEEKKNKLKEIVQDLVPHEVGTAESVRIKDLIHFYEEGGIPSNYVEIYQTYDEAVKGVLDGYIVVLFDHWEKGIGIKAASVERRSIQEPQNEVTINGSREGTSEMLDKNLGLIRTRLKTANFKVIKKTCGKMTKTSIAVCYLEGAVDPNTLQDLLNRLDPLNDEEILETSFIAELIEDSTYSPFPQYRSTERPDVAVSGLLDGKIVIMADGTGSLLICPGLFHEFFQSPADYYLRTVFSSMIRIIRINAYLISLILPSLYIALSTFHVELIPTILLIAILDTREGIPYPALVEGLILVFFFELLQEAGLRLPRPIGSAVSIVGALIIGEAAINAGIASPIMVVAIALTGIASFSIPQYEFGTSARILRIPMMILASFLGGFGIMIGLLLIFLHLSTLRTLGQPYLGTFSPISIDAIKDSIFRAPLKNLLKAPRNKNLHKRPER